MFVRLIKMKRSTANLIQTDNLVDVILYIFILQGLNLTFFLLLYIYNFEKYNFVLKSKKKNLFGLNNILNIYIFNFKIKWIEFCPAKKNTTLQHMCFNFINHVHFWWNFSLRDSFFKTTPKNLVLKVFKICFKNQLRA